MTRIIPGGLDLDHMAVKIFYVESSTPVLLEVDIALRWVVRILGMAIVFDAELLNSLVYSIKRIIGDAGRVSS